MPTDVAKSMISFCNGRDSSRSFQPPMKMYVSLTRMLVMLAVLTLGTGLKASDDVAVAGLLAQISQAVGQRWTVHYDVKDKVITLASHEGVVGVQSGLNSSLMADETPSTLLLCIGPKVDEKDWVEKWKEINREVGELRVKAARELPKPTYRLDFRMFAPVTEAEWKLKLELQQIERQHRLFPTHHWKDLGIVVIETYLVVPIDPDDETAKRIRQDVERVKGLLKAYPSKALHPGEVIASGRCD